MASSRLRPSGRGPADADGRPEAARGEPGTRRGRGPGGDERGAGPQRGERGGEVARRRDGCGIPAGQRLTGAVEEVEGGGGVAHGENSGQSWARRRIQWSSSRPRSKTPAVPDGGRASTRQTRRPGLGRPGTAGWSPTSRHHARRSCQEARTAHTV